MQTKKFIQLLSAVALCGTQASALANQTWPTWLTENLRTSADMSTRPMYYTDEGRSAQTHALGIDIHKVFSTKSRDIATLTAQAYLTNIDDVRGHPKFFEHDQDTQVVYRIFNVNFTGFGGHTPNVKIGHLEVAYGLEHVIDTNGTLRQYGQPKNLGIKADWGVSLNKEHDQFEYEITATTGGGQSLNGTAGSFVYSARLATPRDRNASLGISRYKSKIGGLSRDRTGLDIRLFNGRSNINAEVSSGHNADDRVFNGLIEYNRSNSRESVNGYAQLQFFNKETEASWARSIVASVGATYKPNNHLDLSAQYTHTLKSPTDNNASTIAVQVRYRY